MLRTAGKNESSKISLKSKVSEAAEHNPSTLKCLVSVESCDIWIQGLGELH